MRWALGSRDEACKGDGRFTSRILCFGWEYTLTLRQNCIKSNRADVLSDQHASVNKLHTLLDTESVDLLESNCSPTVIDRYEQGSTLGIPLDSLLFNRCMYLGFEIMRIFYVGGGKQDLKTRFEEPRNDEGGKWRAWPAMTTRDLRTKKSTAKRSRANVWFLKSDRTFAWERLAIDFLSQWRAKSRVDDLL